MLRHTHTHTHSLSLSLLFSVPPSAITHLSGAPGHCEDHVQRDAQLLRAVNVAVHWRVCDDGLSKANTGYVLCTGKCAFLHCPSGSVLQPSSWRTPVTVMFELRGADCVLRYTYILSTGLTDKVRSNPSWQRTSDSCHHLL